jgi:hypothetical protein
LDFRKLENSKIAQKVLGQLTFLAQVMTIRVIHYIRIDKFVLLIWGFWVSKDAEFYVDFKNISLS